MRVCIHNGRIIESQSAATPGTMIANAERAGIFGATEQEMTDAEYNAAMASNPKNAEEHAADKEAVLVEYRTLRDTAVARLNGISFTNFRAGNLDVVAACDVAIAALLSIPQNQAVVAAVGGDATEDTIQALYAAAASQLYASAPTAYSAFRGFDL